MDKEVNVEFHRVEEYGPEYNICSFNTNRFGIVQVEADFGSEDSWWMKTQTPSIEPDLNMFRDRERVYIDQIVMIIHRLINDPQYSFEGLYQ